MKSFTSKKIALEYAKKEIGKNEYEIVKINGQTAILCSTGLPIEKLLRTKFETALEEFITEIGNNPDDVDTRDGIDFLGAEVTSLIMNNSKKYLGVDIISARLDY